MSVIQYDRGLSCPHVDNFINHGVFSFKLQLFVFFFFNFIFKLCIWVCICVLACVFEYRELKGQKRVVDNPELELQVAVSCMK